MVTTYLAWNNRTALFFFQFAIWGLTPESFDIFYELILEVILYKLETHFGSYKTSMMKLFAKKVND